MCILPDELVEEILARAPQDALPKFRSVSKSWKTLIDSKEFKHLRSLKSATRFVFQDARNCKIYATGCLDSPEKMKAATVELGNLPFPSTKTMFSGSSNGVICRLNSSSDSFVLWNPNTNQHLELPLSTPIRTSSYGQETFYGFGYDAARDDYKVFKSVAFGKPFEQSQVYSLNSNSWKNLPKCPFLVAYPASLCSKGVLANNALHWLLCTVWNESERFIIALDLTTEKYHLLPLPQLEETPTKFGTMKLHFLDGCLCLMVSNSDVINANEKVDMWMMMRYGAEDSWTKLIVQFSGAKLGVWELSKLKPIMYSRESGSTYLVFQYGQCLVWWYLVWYDIRKALVDQVAATVAGEEGHVVNRSRAILRKGSSSSFE